MTRYDYRKSFNYVSYALQLNAKFYQLAQSVLICNIKYKELLLHQLFNACVKSTFTNLPFIFTRTVCKCRVHSTIIPTNSSRNDDVKFVQNHSAKIALATKLRAQGGYFAYRPLVIFNNKIYTFL